MGIQMEKKKKIYIKIIVISVLLILLISPAAYFIDALGNLFLILTILDCIVLFIGITGLGLKLIKTDLFSFDELKSIVVFISIIAALPIACSFFNKVIVTANRYTQENIKQDKIDILVNLDKNKFLVKLEQYHFYVNGHDLKEDKSITKNNIKYYYETEECFNDVKNVEGIINNQKVEYKALMGVNSDIYMKIGLVDEWVMGRTIGSYFENNDIILLTNSYEIDEIKKFLELQGKILENNYDEVVLHEYLHKLLKKSGEERGIDFNYFPQWFIEGTGTYISRKTLDLEMLPSEGKVKDLTNDENFRGNKAAEYYAESAFLIEYLLETYGDTIIVDILNDMSKTKDIYKSLENVTGQTFDNIV